MMTEIVTNLDGSPIPEGILDVMVTSLIALHDLKIKANSKKGSFYMVKPKLHGPEEVEFTMKLFSLVEKALSLKENTLKNFTLDKMNEKFEQILNTYVKEQPKLIPFNMPSVNSTKMQIPKLNKI